MARRARKLGVQREPYTVVEIADRDGWVCSICTEDIDSALAYPAEMSRSIDHIVPLCEGGDDIRTNVAIAHLLCNKRKGRSLIATVEVGRQLVA
jgi:5-methylcytosine-specific restriction endonuclease McrA